MNPNDDDPLLALDREAAPPPELKARVRRSLQQRGLLRNRVHAAMRAAGLIAAALVLFVAGLMVGNRRAEAPPAAGAMYALLLYEDAGFQRDRPHEEYVEEYGKWAGELRGRGALVQGEALDSTAQLLSPAPSGIAVEARDASSDLGVIAGFFIIRATSRAEALEIAMSCPHLNHGGRIALRPIIPT